MSTAVAAVTFTENRFERNHRNLCGNTPRSRERELGLCLAQAISQTPNRTQVIVVADPTHANTRNYWTHYKHWVCYFLRERAVCYLRGKAVPETDLERHLRPQCSKQRTVLSTEDLMTACCVPQSTAHRWRAARACLTRWLAI
jgi:hypothetical protein